MVMDESVKHYIKAICNVYDVVKIYTNSPVDPSSIEPLGTMVVVIYRDGSHLDGLMTYIKDYKETIPYHPMLKKIAEDVLNEYQTLAFPGVLERLGFSQVSLCTRP